MVECERSQNFGEFNEEAFWARGSWIMLICTDDGDDDGDDGDDDAGD